MEKITSRRNPLFQTIRKLSASASFRQEAGLYVCEGPKLYGEAVRWGARIHTVVSAAGTQVDVPAGARHVEAPEDTLRTLSDTKSPQGPVFLCSLPDLKTPRPLPKGRYVVLDGVQDPGNLGTIWRTADALGAAGLLLTGPCADPFGPKAVRSTMGACFRLAVWRAGAQELKAALEQSGIPLWSAALRADSRDVRDVALDCAAVVIGSEGRGVSERLLAMSEGTLRIPMEARCESLNAAAAAAIVLWEGCRGADRRQA